MRHKRIFRILSMAICATMAGVPFTSCSDSETESLDATESTDVIESAKVALSISASKQNGSGSEARKDGYDAEDFESGDEIGLYVLSADDLQSAYIDEETCYNVRAVYDGSSWTMDNDIFLTEGDAYVIAYYPYDSLFVNTLPTSSSDGLLFDLTPSGSAQTDVLASDGVTVSSSSPKAKLSLSHVLTRITLTIEVADDITTSGTLTSMSISADELYGDVGLYIDESGSFQTYSTTNAGGLTLSLNKTLSTDEETIVDFLIPSESSTTLTAELVIKNDNTYSTGLIPYDGAWAAGYQYTGTIVLTTVEDTSGYEGDYYAVDLGGSVRWATINIGAESEKDWGNFYAWGEIEVPSDGKYSSGNCRLYGDTSVSDISGNATYDAATANWGGSWRMPTYEEMDELADTLTYDWEFEGTFNAYDEENGMRVTGTNGNNIFLPHTGFYRGTTHYNGGTSYDMYIGLYWSSQQYDDGDAYYLYSTYITTTSHTGWAVYMNPMNKYDGHPVRAVCDKPEKNSVTLY